MTLLNFGPTPTLASFVVSGAFTLLAFLSLSYAGGVYLDRSKAIRTRKVAKYYDKWGPSVLCACLFVAIALNFVYEGRDREWW